MTTPLQTFTRLACAFSLLAASASQAQVGMRQIQSNGMPITLVYPTEAAVQPHNQGSFTVQVANTWTRTSAFASMAWPHNRACNCCAKANLPWAAC